MPFEPMSGGRFAGPHTYTARIDSVTEPAPKAQEANSKESFGNWHINAFDRGVTFLETFS
jgi:hypothetical protein